MNTTKFNNVWQIIQFGFAIIIFVPLVYFCFFLVPNLEDISLSNLQDYSNVFDYISSFYTGFDGRYSTNFFHYYNPLTFGNIDVYKFLPIGTIILLCLSINSAFSAILKTQKVKYEVRETLISSFFIAACFFSWVYSLPHILYWFGSTLVYLYPITFYLFFVSFYLRNRLTEKNGNKKLYLYLAGLCIFFGIGLSELSLFFFNFTIIAYFIYLKVSKKTVPGSFKKLLGVLIFSSLLFVLAPGIWERKAMFAQEGVGMPIYTPFLHLIKHNFYFFISALVPTFFCSIMLNIYWGKRLDPKPLSIKKMILLYTGILFLIALVSAAYYIPSGYFEYFPARIFNSIFAFYLIVVIPLLYVVFKDLGNKIKLGAVAILFLIIITNKSKPFFQSIKLLQSKEYLDHYQHFQDRVECLKYCSENDVGAVYLKPFEVSSDLITYPPYLRANRLDEYWNEAYEDFFDVDLVLLVGDTIDPNALIAE